MVQTIYSVKAVVWPLVALFLRIVIFLYFEHNEMSLVLTIQGTDNSINRTDVIKHVCSIHGVYVEHSVERERLNVLQQRMYIFCKYIYLKTKNGGNCAAMGLVTGLPQAYIRTLLM